MEQLHACQLHVRVCSTGGATVCEAAPFGAELSLEVTYEGTKPSLCCCASLCACTALSYSSCFHRRAGGDGCAPAHSGHTFQQGYMISRDSCHTRSCDMPDSSLSGYSGPGPHGQGKALSHIPVIHVLRLLLPPTYLSDTACWLFFAHFPTRELVAM